MRFQGHLIQESPSIFAALIPGKWLLERTTPTWRIKDPHMGFQRMVSAKRARQIAIAVLDQARTFPNSIILATDQTIDLVNDSGIEIPEDISFLVVDGQHRLWAQNFSQFQARYACVIHTQLSIEDMAQLFLEINDNQKRVPSSLRWDLVRLVRPEDDPDGIAAAEIVYQLATEEGSPFFQRIDLTGEQSEIQLKQGSLAPEFKRLVSKRSPLSSLPYQSKYELILNFGIAIQQIDYDQWGTRESVFFKARILRALFRLMGDIVRMHNDESINVARFINYLEKIDSSSLSPDVVRSAQGSAGIKAIYDQIRGQVLDDIRK